MRHVSLALATLPPVAEGAAAPALPQDIRSCAMPANRPDSSMTIDRSGPTSALIAALRADISRRSERNRSAAPTSEAQGRDTAMLRRELVDLVRSTPADDPQTRDALQRRVIETVLRWEFTADPARGGDAPPMIEQIARTLQADPRHGEQFARLVRELQRP